MTKTDLDRAIGLANEAIWTEPTGLISACPSIVSDIRLLSSALLYSLKSAREANEIMHILSVEKRLPYDAITEWISRYGGI